MDDEAPAAGAPAATPRTRPERRRLRLLLGFIVVVTVTNMIGDVLAAGLVEEHPLWLISLNSRKRWILAVVPHTDVAPFFVVAVLRQLLSDPVYYALGRWYGDAGARWIEKKMGEGGSVIRWLESGFAKASWPMVAIFRTFGDVFGGPIGAVTGFLNDYRLPIMAVSFVLVALNFALNKKQGKSELESVSELERELEEEAARDEPGPSV
jgi:hypothetical protein